MYGISGFSSIFIISTDSLLGTWNDDDEKWKIINTSNRSLIYEFDEWILRLGCFKPMNFMRIFYQREELILRFSLSLHLSSRSIHSTREHMGTRDSERGRRRSEKLQSWNDFLLCDLLAQRRTFFDDFAMAVFEATTRVCGANDDVDDRPIKQFYESLTTN